MPSRDRGPEHPRASPGICQFCTIGSACAFYTDSGVFCAVAPVVAMASSPQSPFAFLAGNPVFNGLSNAYTIFQEKRAKLGLSNPGTVETIAKGMLEERQAEHL